MDYIVEEIKKAGWNIAALIISFGSLLYLYVESKNFLDTYGTDNGYIEILRKIFTVDGYIGDTFWILLSIAITLVLFSVTAFISYWLIRYNDAQLPWVIILFAVSGIVMTFNIAVIPYLLTLLILIVMGGLLIAIVNNSDTIQRTKR